MQQRLSTVSVGGNRFHGYYAAKFAREARENPTHWIIVPSGNGWYELRKMGGYGGKTK